MMRNFIFFGRKALVLAALGAMGPGSGALALGGSASAPDSGLKAHLVMVLSRQANRHGACTGTVVAPNVVLTAAHCVAGNKMLAIAYAEGESHTLQRVSAKAINPGYSGKSRVSVDLALVRLDSPLPARFTPLALDLDGGAHGIGQSRRLAGYGLVAEHSDSSGGSLRSAEVSILPKLYPRFMRLGLEAQGNLNDFAICTGDSGGPVLDGALVVGVVYGREKFGRARDCGFIAQAVRLAPQAGWINSVLAGWRGQAVAVPRRPLSLTAQD